MNARHREGRAAEAREERSASKSMLGELLATLCRAYGSTADARNQAHHEVQSLLRLARRGELSTAPLNPRCPKGVGESHKHSKKTCHMFCTKANGRKKFGKSEVKETRRAILEELNRVDRSSRGKGWAWTEDGVTASAAGAAGAAPANVESSAPIAPLMPKPLAEAPPAPPPGAPPDAADDADDAFDLEDAVARAVERVGARDAEEKGILARDASDGVRAGTPSDQVAYEPRRRPIAYLGGELGAPLGDAFGYAQTCAYHLVPRASASGRVGLMPRPSVLDLRRLGRRHHLVDFHDASYDASLRAYGFPFGPPCPACEGSGQGPPGGAAGYHRTHRVSLKENYASVIGLDGVDEPVHSAFSQCDCCGHKFYHASHDFLVKLPVELQSCYAASPPYATGTVHFSKELTLGIDHMLRSRGGFETLSKSLQIRAAQVCTEQLQLFASRGQVWWAQRSELGQKWDTMPDGARARVVDDYAEYVYYKDRDKLTLPDCVSDIHNVRSFNVRAVPPDLVRDKWLKAFQLSQAHHRLTAFSATVALKSVAIDFSARPGKKLGHKWLLTLTNERYELIAACGTDGVGVDGIVDLLEELKPRTGPQLLEVELSHLTLVRSNDTLVVGAEVYVVHGLQNIRGRVATCDAANDFYEVMTEGAKVIFIDNVPHKSHEKLEPVEGSYVAKLKTSSGIPRVAQDRFHVMHNAGTFFNNFDTRYRRMAIVELRHSAFERRQGDVNIVDDLLTRGKISISRTLGDGTRVDVKEGKVVRATTIKNWKRTGVYDELFCAGSALCVRQDLREDEELEGKFRYWLQQLEQLVGVEDPDRPGSYLITSGNLASLERNLLDRLKNCRLPEDYDAWYHVPGQHFFTAPIYHQSGGTNCNENKHGLSQDYMVADRGSDATSTALMLNGHVPANLDATRRRHLAVDYGHYEMHDIGLTNRLFVGAGPNLTQLVSRRPYDYDEPSAERITPAFAASLHYDPSPKSCTVVSKDGLGHWTTDARTKPPDFQCAVPKPLVSPQLCALLPSVFPPPVADAPRSSQKRPFAVAFSQPSRAKYSDGNRSNTSNCDYICTCLPEWPLTRAGNPGHDNCCDRKLWQLKPSVLPYKPVVGYVAVMKSKASGKRKDVKFLGGSGNKASWQEIE